MAKFRLPCFHFRVRPALAEGTVARKLYRLSIERLDAGQYPNSHAVNQILAYLRPKDGVGMEQLLKEIRERQKQPGNERVHAYSNPPQPSKRAATIKENAHPLPLFTTKDENDFDSLREEA